MKADEPPVVCSNAKLALKQSPASKGVNMETEEAMALKSLPDNW